MSKKLDEGSEYITKLHSEILVIMDSVDKICSEHNIQYYLIGGTLLGAVRHGGFIPWDDDFDICMPRVDFNRFIEIAPQCLEAPLQLTWITTRNKYCRAFAKVSNSNTVFYEGVKYDDSADLPGIFVDIFPLDDSYGYSNRVKRRKNIITKLKVIMDLKARNSATGIKKIICNMFTMKKYNKIMYYFMSRDNNKGNTEWYTNYGSQYNARKQTIRKDLYGLGERVKFEDRFYMAPEDSEKVLTSIFGNDYMQLPPVEKRRTHYPLKVRFSDGLEMDFERPEHRVSVE
ncbi:MAG: LicD family protein [Aeriscardovia sp.]|nr:LicD family protein [Clostridia bacterium]MBO5632724.1 LicD family protein [Aeriscardovia sp.]